MGLYDNTIVGVVHAKGSSERVMRKNFCLVDRVPLFLCQALNLAQLIGKNNVYVDSENLEILDIASQNGFQTILRERNLASNATGGVALLKNFYNSLPKHITPETMVQLFPPMPLLDIKSLTKGIHAVHNEKSASSSFFLGQTKKYLWDNEKPVYGSEGLEIPNSIDLNALLYELPTAYIVNVNSFLNFNSRVCEPRHILTPNSQFSEIDIDIDEDFTLVNSLIRTPMFQNDFQFFNQVRVKYPPIIFWDVDGTLTDGFYNSGKTGELFKAFNTYDGIAFKELKQLGVTNCLVSASKSDDILLQRSKIIGADLLTNVEDKVHACRTYAEAKGFNLRECYFVGNDVNDLQVMQASGRSFCPENSNKYVLQWAENLNISSTQGVARALKDKLHDEKTMGRYQC
jgi:YrbI family 3-deoxy-D-manno-octulosonate 8-phosphate phosphatase